MRGVGSPRIRTVSWAHGHAPPPMDDARSPRSLRIRTVPGHARSRRPQAQCVVPIASPSAVPAPPDATASMAYSSDRAMVSSGIDGVPSGLSTTWPGS